MVTFCFIYNAWAIPFRQFFNNYQHPGNIRLWLISDYLSDFVFLLDILMIKYRIMFMKNGFWVKDHRELCKFIMALYSFKRKIYFFSIHGNLWVYGKI